MVYFLGNKVVPIYIFSATDYKIYNGISRISKKIAYCKKVKLCFFLERAK